MLWVLFVFQLSRGPEETSISPTHFAQQVQNSGTKGVVLGLEVSPEGAHQIPHYLLHSRLQKLWVEAKVAQTLLSISCKGIGRMNAC